jgi:hypothetical protein
MQHVKTMLACMAATLLFSCSKKDEDKTTPVTPSTDKLVGSWKTIADVADRPVHHWSSTEFTTDLWTLEKDCRKDDLLIFKADGTYATDEGATKCNATDEQTSEASPWKKSGSTLTITEDGIDYNVTINKLDDSSLVITGQRWYIINGDTTFYNATTTYSRQ